MSKNCPKPKKKKAARASAAAPAGEPAPTAQFEQAMANAMSNLKGPSQAASLLVRGLEKSQRSQSEVRASLIADQNPPNANSGIKKLNVAPCPPLNGTSSLGLSLAARMNLEDLSETNIPSPRPTASKASAAFPNKSAEESATAQAKKDQEEAKRQLKDHTQLLKNEVADIAKQASTMTCSPISGNERPPTSPMSPPRPRLPEASTSAWTPAPTSKKSKVLWSNTGRRGLMASQRKETEPTRTVSPSVAAMMDTGTSKRVPIPISLK
jgi:hypothetical protein